MPTPTQKRYGQIKNFTVVKEVLCNNYRSCNLTGPYHFWVISPRNSTLFTRPFLAGRRVRAGHETMLEGPADALQVNLILRLISTCETKEPSNIGGFKGGTSRQIAK